MAAGNRLERRKAKRPAANGQATLDELSASRPLCNWPAIGIASPAGDEPVAAGGEISLVVTRGLEGRQAGNDELTA